MLIYSKGRKKFSDHMAELCPPQICMFKSSPLVPQNVAVFGDRDLTEVTKVT
jgi:hypothetical protein